MGTRRLLGPMSNATHELRSFCVEWPMAARALPPLWGSKGDARSYSIVMSSREGIEESQIRHSWGDDQGAGSGLSVADELIARHRPAGVAA